MIGCISLFIRPEAPKVTLYPICSSCRVVVLDRPTYLHWKYVCPACTRFWEDVMEKNVARRRVDDAIERAYEANR